MKRWKTRRAEKPMVSRHSRDSKGLIRGCGGGRIFCMALLPTAIYRWLSNLPEAQTMACGQLFCGRYPPQRTCKSVFSTIMRSRNGMVDSNRFRRRRCGVASACARRKCLACDSAKRRRCWAVSPLSCQQFDSALSRQWLTIPSLRCLRLCRDHRNVTWQGQY